MTMRDLHNNVAPVQALAAQTISQGTGALTSGNVDLAGFNAAQVVVHYGDIDELGGSPVGGAQIAIKLEHADDNGSGSPGTYGDVTLSDVVGPASVTAGVVATATSDLGPTSFGYVGDKRFIRVTLTPGLVEVYAQVSNDNADFSNSGNDLLVGIVQMNGTAAVIKVFSVPVHARYLKLRVANAFGAALAATGNSMNYVPVSVDQG